MTKQQRYGQIQFILNQQTIQQMEPQFNNRKRKSKWNEIQVELKSQIVQALQKSKFNQPVPVQSAAIPLMLKNYDLAVQAQTGSGKTLAFVIPLLQRFLGLTLPLPKTIVKFMILSPTRELCQQTYAVIKKVLENIPDKNRGRLYLAHVKCVTGGNDLNFDVQETNGKAIVLIGTVGRIKQLSGHFDANWLKKVDYLYIDEADRVLKEKGINELMRNIQKIRRTAMFSATLQGLEQKHYQFYGMRNLAKISLKSMDKQKGNQQKRDNQNENQPKKQQIKAAYTIPGSLSNTCMIMPNRMQKINFLIFFLQAHLLRSKTIVFVNTCASVEFYSKLLNEFFSKHDPEMTNLVYGIHGKLKNNRRARIIKNFTDSKNGCLISTDVTSRGIDFDRIHYIIQIDPPEDPDNYIHRIGRTARINRPGVAILMIEPHEQAFINYLSNKSVGVKLIQNPSHFIPNYEAKYENHLSGAIDILKEFMLSDRDYIEKAKKAFVSYIRSYKQHDLKYIFEFKNLSIGFTAQSFFLLRIPRIKEILGKKINNFTQSQINPEDIPWKNKNQQQIYERKKERLLQLRQMRDKQKAISEAKIDIKNKKSRRKRIKQKRMRLESKSLGKDYNELKRQKKGKGKIEQSEDDESSSNFENEDTQQIEQRLGVNRK